MARGILSGLALGAVASIGLAVGASLVMMPPSGARVEPEGDGDESAVLPESPEADGSEEPVFEIVADPAPGAEVDREAAADEAEVAEAPSPEELTVDEPPVAESEVEEPVREDEAVVEALPKAEEAGADEPSVEEALTVESAPAVEPEPSAETAEQPDAEVAQGSAAGATIPEIAEAPVSSAEEGPAITIIEETTPESAPLVEDATDVAEAPALTDAEPIETEEVSALEPETAEPVAEEAETAVAELTEHQNNTGTLVPSASEAPLAVAPVTVLDRGEETTTEPVAEAEVIVADTREEVTGGVDPAPPVSSAPAEIASPAEVDTAPEAAPEDVIAGQEVDDTAAAETPVADGDTVAADSSAAPAELPSGGAAADPAPVEAEELAQADLPTEEAPQPFRIIDDEASEGPPNAEEDTAATEAVEPEGEVAETTEQAEPGAETAPSPRIGLIQPQGEAGFGDRGTGVRILRPGQPEADEAVEEATPEPEAIPEDAPAVRRFAAEFEGDGTGALLGIVLIDSPQAAVAASDLSGLGFPVTVGLDPGGADATERMRVLRSAGMEVALVPDVPSGATPADLEQAFGIYLDAVPEAIAVLDASLQPISSDRALLTQTTAILGESGLGLVAPARGLTDPVREAAAAGIPAATIYRELDGSDPDGMRRVLDQAAFQARQQGSVVLLGDLVPDTITALQEWSETSRAGQVDLAPVSAVLLEGSE